MKKQHWLNWTHQHKSIFFSFCRFFFPAATLSVHSHNMQPSKCIYNIVRTLWFSWACWTTKHYLKFWMILYRLNRNITLSHSIPHRPSPAWGKPKHKTGSQNLNKGNTTETIWSNTLSGQFNNRCSSLFCCSRKSCHWDGTSKVPMC